MCMTGTVSVMREIVWEKRFASPLDGKKFWRERERTTERKNSCQREKGERRTHARERVERKKGRRNFSPS